MKRAEIVTGSTYANGTGGARRVLGDADTRSPRQ